LPPQILTETALDLVLSNRSVLLGNGDGTFQDAQNYNPGNNAGVAEVVADLNGDGKPDLAVTTSHFLTVLLNISAGGAQDFQVGASPLSPATISAGGSSTSTITITSMNGFNGSVSLSCSTISPSVTPAPACSFSPGSVTNGSGTATLTVSTTAPHSLSGMSASRQRPRGLGWMATGGLVMVGVLWFGAPWRRRVAGASLMVLLFFAAGTGCGGGGGKTGGTPAGSYTVTVSATSTSPQLSRTTNLTLKVQ
jgi:hypothetical protein